MMGPEKAALPPGQLGSINFEISAPPIPEAFRINPQWGEVLFICATPEGASAATQASTLYCAKEILPSGFKLGHDQLAELVCQNLRVAALQIRGGGVFRISGNQIHLLRSSGSFGPALKSDLREAIVAQLGEVEISDHNEAAVTNRNGVRLKIYHGRA
jgi:hypothetical protein